MNWGRLYNPIMSAILRSPLHGMLSGSIVLIGVRGRKSGKRISTPVNYLRDGQDLLVVSMRERNWWRNLRGGAPVTLRLQGRDFRATGQAVEDPAAVGEALLRVLRLQPGYAQFLGVTLAPDGRASDADALARAAAQRVVVIISGLSPAER